MSKPRWTNYVASSQGSVMIEFAIMLPLLLLILFGITELGRALYQQNTLTQAVKLGARYMARVENAVNTDDSADCEKSDNWDNAVTTAKNLISCGVEGTSDCADVVFEDIDINIDVCGPTSPHVLCNSPSKCVIVVEASTDFKSLFGDELISLPGFHIEALQLTATTQERYIGN